MSATTIWIIIALLILFPQFYYYKITRDFEGVKNTKKYFIRNKRNFDDHQEIYLTNYDGHDIFIRLYEVANPKAIVHIIHGMAEHSYNYIDFIKFLNANGFTVIAHDHRGHGKSISEKYPTGYMRLTEEVIDDVYAVNSFARETHPGLKVYMIGHSMGSMISRLYLQKYDDTIEKLVLTGTVEHSKVAAFGLFLGNIITFYFNKYQPAILSPLLPGSKGDDTWISYNMDNVIDKRNDKQRVQTFLERGVVTIIDMNNKMSKVRRYMVKNPDLSILSATGSDDIVTGSDKGLEYSINTLKNAGYANIDNIVYDHMRHEILNEEDRSVVYEDILEFFNM